MTPSLLRVDDLRTRFPTARGLVHAVDGVSFELAPREVVGVVGESGSGKSVLARSIMGLLPTDAETTGTIRFEDRPDAERGREIAMIFQDPMKALNPVMRVGRQITESLTRHLGLGREDARARAVELLGQVGIPDPGRRCRAYPHELSGGMRQRVAIAVAIACSPKLLIADEPTTALDVTVQRQILDLLAELRRRSAMSVLLITHDLAVVAGRTDRVLVMYGGRVVEAGPTASVFRAPRHPYTGALLAAIARIEAPSHTRLAAIPGRPVDVVDPAPSCRFAARCARAQATCVEQDPVWSDPAPDGHGFACFFPLGSVAGDEALARNVARGETVSGLAVAR